MPGGSKNDGKVSNKPLSSPALAQSIGSTGSGSGQLFGSLPKATGFLRRNGGGEKKKANSSTPSQAVAPGLQGGVASVAEDARVSWPVETKNLDAIRMDERRVPADYTFERDLHRSESTKSGSSSLTSPLPEFDPRRRGSAVSTSSMSQSPHGGSYGYGNPRHSRSSFASSTGSPLASASLFSNSTTIGDLSTASMPLLPQGGGVGGADPSMSSYRMNADSSSAASFSDASSVHSYPPPPPIGVASRSPRPPSARSSAQEASHEHWLSWVREVTGQSISPYSDRGRTRLVADSGQNSRTSRSGSFGSMRSTASPPSSSNRPSGLTLSLSSGGNPLMPLRKRLARVLRSGRQGSVEVQLLLELIDGLEHYIREAEFASDPPASPAQLNESNSTPPMQGAEALTVGHNSTATPSTSMHERSEPPKQICIDLLSEIRSLVKELIEFAPDAQVCLTAGKYGPLAFPIAAITPNPYKVSSGATQLPTLPAATTSAMVAHDLRERERSEAQWWPRRLSRDCRALLEDVGFPTLASVASNGGLAMATGSTAPIAGAEEASGRRGSSLITTSLGPSDLTATAELEEALSALNVLDADSTTRAALTMNGLSGIDLAHHHQQQFQDPRSSPADAQILPSLLLHHSQGRNGPGLGGAKPTFVGPSSKSGDSTAIAARRELLLVEGQKRWDAYRKRQAETS